MAINFGGLATGLDTEALISALMDVERQPLERLERDKTFFNSRLDAYKKLDTKLKSLLTTMEDLDEVKEVNVPKATSDSDTYLGVSATSDAQFGSFQVEVVDLARNEKQISQGYADKATNSFGTGTLTVTVNGTSTDITIDSNNNSLEGIAQAINDADAGISASVINDGTGTPYRLVVTGDEVQDSADGATSAITLDTSGLSGGTDASPSMTVAQYAQKAHIRVDTIDIYNKTNTLNEAVEGVTLDLRKAESGTFTTVTVEKDESALEEKLNNFVSAYNAVVSFIDNQADADWGGDSGLRNTKRRMQDLLTTQIAGAGTYAALAQIGIATDHETGLISLKSSELTDATAEDLDSVVNMLIGGDGYDGIATKFKDYLEGTTDFVNGLYKSTEASVNSNVRRIDANISRMEARLEAREEVLRSQFAAMESLVSSLNSQSTYLAQQMSSIANIGRK